MKAKKKSSPDIRETLRASAEQDNASQTDKKKTGGSPRRDKTSYLSEEGQEEEKGEKEQQK